MASLEFTGTSNKGDLQEALNDAIQKALESVSANTPDKQVRWEFETMWGTRGGFAGVNEINVAIHVTGE